MRRSTLLLLLATLAVWAFASIGTSSAHTGCGTTHSHTKAESCKNRTTGALSCGKKGVLVGKDSGVPINVYANTDGDGAEAEFCSDSGSGNQQGRLLVTTSTSQQGARVILDSDDEQQFPGGYIIVQGSAKSGNQNGVYCTPTGTVGDGYAASWTNPGTEGGTTPDQWAECLPGQ